jgi:host factor-I protein
VKDVMAMTSGENKQVQDEFLNDLRKRRQTVSIYLVNGVRQSGVIASFDRNALLVKQGTTHAFFFKHMIATVMASTNTMRKPAPSNRPERQAADRSPAVVVTKKVLRRQGNGE